jgi:hypothetical protein
VHTPSTQQVVTFTREVKWLTTVQHEETGKALSQKALSKK